MKEIVFVGVFEALGGNAPSTQSFSANRYLKELWAEYIIEFAQIFIKHITDTKSNGILLILRQQEKPQLEVYYFSSETN